ncbi:MAG: sigma-54 dependent transcriptional regulator [Blastomonas sp.]
MRNQRETIDNLLLGESEAMRELRALIRFAAGSQAPVLVTGPSGSGKEVVARALHAGGRQGHHPFVATNCGAIPEDLIESELFGHERGSFTGAIARYAGLFERAGEGTLFLDEIAEMHVSVQVRLLRVLEERRFRRVGGDTDLDSRARIIAATHQCLDTAIGNGAFREDLFYRLCVLPIHLPPLEQRREDIPILVEHFLERCPEQVGGAPPRFSQCAMLAMQMRNWPGQVCELRNLVERAALFFPGGDIGREQLAILLAVDRRPNGQGMSDISAQPYGESFAKVGEDIDLNAYLKAEEHRLLLQALDRADGVVAAAARSLGLQRSTFFEKMKRFGIRRDDVLAA